MHARSERGFTLVELAMVTLILGVLVTITLPYFVQARLVTLKRICFENQRLADSAFENYSANRGEVGPSTVSGFSGLMDVLVPNYLKADITCPGGGSYSWANEKLDCDRHGSYLEP